MAEPQDFELADNTMTPTLWGVKKGRAAMEAYFDFALTPTQAWHIRVAVATELNNVEFEPVYDNYRRELRKQLKRLDAFLVKHPCTDKRLT